MGNRDPFGKGSKARRLLDQPAPSEQETNIHWPSVADERARTNRAMAQLRNDVSVFRSALQANKVQPYTFSGKAPRTRLTSTHQAYNPVTSKRQSRLLAGGTSSSYDLYHDITFRGWPIGDFAIVPVSGEDSYAEGKSLILLEAGKVALGSTGIYGVFSGEKVLTGGRYDPRLPNRERTIDIGRLHEGFPVSIHSLTPAPFVEALGSRVGSPVDVMATPSQGDIESFQVTMTMVLQRG